MPGDKFTIATDAFLASSGDWNHPDIVNRRGAESAKYKFLTVNG
jgi:hypothetical protein